jgi:hypothetical protein
MNDDPLAVVSVKGEEVLLTTQDGETLLTAFETDLLAEALTHASAAASEGWDSVPCAVFPEDGA